MSGSSSSGEQAASAYDDHDAELMFDPEFANGYNFASTHFKSLLVSTAINYATKSLYSATLAGGVHRHDVQNESLSMEWNVAVPSKASSSSSSSPQSTPFPFTCTATGGRMFAGGAATGELGLWNAHSGEVVGIWNQHTSKVGGCVLVNSSTGAVSNDLSTLPRLPAQLGDDGQPLVDVDTGAVIDSGIDIDKDVYDSIYTVGHDGYFLVRNLEVDRIIHSYIACTCPIAALVVESPHIVYTGSWDGTVRLLDLRVKGVAQQYSTQETGESPVRALCTTTGAAVELVRPHMRKKRKPRKNKVGDEPSAATVAAQMSDTILFAAHGIGGIISWDIRTGNVLVPQYQGHSDVVHDIRVINNRLFSGAEDKTVKIFDVLQGACLQTLRGHKHGVIALQSCDKKLLTGSFDRTIRSFNLQHVDAAIAATLAQQEEDRRLAYAAWKASGKKGKKGTRKKGGKSKSKKKPKSSKDIKKAALIESCKQAFALLRPMIGVVFVDGPPNGVLVTDIREGKPCDLAGMKDNDVITIVNGEPVQSNQMLMATAKKFKPGDTVPFVVERKGGLSGEGEEVEAITLQVLVQSSKASDKEVRRLRRIAGGEVTSKDLKDFKGK